MNKRDGRKVEVKKKTPTGGSGGIRRPVEKKPPSPKPASPPKAPPSRPVPATPKTPPSRPVPKPASPPPAPPKALPSRPAPKQPLTPAPGPVVPRTPPARLADATPVKRQGVLSGPARAALRRAAARQTERAGRPLPPPPKARTVGAGATTTAATAANQAIVAEIQTVQSRFAALQSEAQLGTIYDAIGRIDNHMAELPLIVENLRDRGYVHSGEWEGRLAKLDDRWEVIRHQLEMSLQDHVRRLDKDLDAASPVVSHLSLVNQATVRAAHSVVEGLSQQIAAASSALQSLVGGIDDDLNQLGFQVAAVGRMMDLLDGSPEMQLLAGEGLLRAVTAEWEQDGEEGPDGVLFLTDQRLIFEQREEVVTRKVLGLFKADSEQVQRVLLDVLAQQIESVEHREEGGFLGMGKAGVLELILSADAPVSRARFHLHGQDSADWASMIRRIQTREIDDERAEKYMAEMAAAEAVTFPSHCPNCFAAVPAPPRGVTNVICEFCGSTIVPL